MTAAVRCALAWAAIENLHATRALWHLLVRLTRRHVTDPTPPVWVNDGHPDILAAWERDIRTPGLLEQCITEELGA